MSWPYLWPSNATKRKDRSFFPFSMLIFSQVAEQKQKTLLRCVSMGATHIHSALFFSLSLSLLVMFYDGKIYASLITWPFSYVSSCCCSTRCVLRASNSGFCVLSLLCAIAHTRPPRKRRKQKAKRKKTLGPFNKNAGPGSSFPRCRWGIFSGSVLANVSTRSIPFPSGKMVVAIYARVHR